MGECRAATSLIHALLGFAASSNPQMRQSCLKSLYYLFHWQPSALLSQMQKYVALLLRCMADSQMENCQRILTDSLIVVMNEHWERLSQGHSTVAMFDFMLSGTRSADQYTACAAAEFWALYATDGSKEKAVLVDYLPKLLPVLVRHCRYTDELLALIDFDNDDQAHADLSEDVAPVFYQWRLRSST